MRWKQLFFTLVFSVAICLFAASLDAAPVWTEQSSPEKLQLIAGKSIIVRSADPIKRISEPEKEIATALILSPYEIYITGKSAGVTSLIVWKNDKQAHVYDIVVSFDTSRLKENLHELLPNEQDIHVTATGNAITLSGRVSSAGSLSRALALAQEFAPEGKIVNMVDVNGVHQVMLEVRIAEMSRQVSKRLGINFSYARAGEFGISLLGGLTGIVKPTDAVLGAGAVGLAVSPAINALFRFNSGSATWTGLIDALKEDGLVKVLAEPTLIALSGQEATFLAGGEYPIPVPQGFDQITIEYKQFGVRLMFIPTVLSENRIGIDVAPEVSELDFTTAVQFSGFVVPGISTRKASTRIELADGQSFAIAGLLSESVRESVSKFPVLGDIPVLGALFRSSQFVKNETELIIIVTPHLVKPLDLRNQSLPTDFFIEPSDTEFFLEGMLEGRSRNSRQAKGEFQGKFGHLMPDSE
jgi:pilus assembly protein CpaC